MHVPDPTSAYARRELVLVASLLVAMARLVEAPDAFLVAGLLPIVILVAGVGILGGDESKARPFEALLVPAVLTGGAAAAIQLVPAGLGLVPYLLVFAFLLDRTLLLEMRLLAQPGGATEADRARVLLAAVVAAFVAFTGIAALYPAACRSPAGRRSARVRTSPGSGSWSSPWTTPWSRSSSGTAWRPSATARRRTRFARP